VSTCSPPIKQLVNAEGVAEMVPKSKSEMTASVPERIGKYRIIGNIGNGGMAEVFLAVASGSGGFNKLHVLKLLRQDTFDNTEAIRAFQSEARVAALLNHPNVVQTYEVGEDEGNVYMVMEYLEGANLQVVLNYVRRANLADGLTLDMRMRIVVEILSGLHYVHELRDLTGQPLNLVHRDVTPHNIFVTYDGGIKLLDFGIAKSNSFSTGTQVGTIKGKVAYMAPEQVSSPDRISRRTDIFQIGLILWEGVIGRRMWAGLSECDVLLKLANNTGFDLIGPPTTDPELLRICQRAIAIAPQDRYATAEEFATELESYMASRGIRTRARDVGTYVAQLFASHRKTLRDAIQLQLRDTEHSSKPFGSGAPPTLPNLYPFPVSGNSTSSTQQPAELDGRSGVLASPGPSLLGRWPPRVWKTAALTTLSAALLALGVRALTSASSPNPPSEKPASPAEQAQMVELAVAASPAHARLFLDDVPLPSNPYRGQVKRDTGVHYVRAEAAEFVSTSLRVHLDRNSESMIALKPVSSAPASGAPVRADDREPVAQTASRSRALGRPTHAAPRVAAVDPNEVPPQKPERKDVNTSPAVSAIKLDNSDPWR